MKADTERARLRDLRERLLIAVSRAMLTDIRKAGVASRAIEIARQWVKFVEEG